MTRFVRTIRLSLKSLLLHKLRSGLTMLGIVFGVFSVIAMLAIGEGASKQAQQQVLQLGATNIIVRSVKPPEDVAASRSTERQNVLRYGLTRDDRKLLSATVPTAKGLVPLRETMLDARNNKYSLTARVVGCTPEYQSMNHLDLARGRFLTEKDLHDQSNIVVLASEAAEKLFPLEEPLDKILRISSQTYRIVGITKPRAASAAVGGSLSGQDFSNDIYMPLETFQSRINVADIVVRYASGSFNLESVVYNQFTLEVDKIEDVIPTAELVRETMNRAHRLKQDVAVIVPLELLKQADQLRNIFNIVLGSIAGISLLVGGIGIMNIMLATVTERTREIGIRRALGARRGDIIQQFLAETVVLSGSGGIVGLTLGLCTPLAFAGMQMIVTKYILDKTTATSDVGRMFLEMSPRVAFWSLPLAFGVSVLTGIVFGVYPARTAARLDPIEALRHE